ncbi:MAG: hypothetical protein R6X02_16080 [Enhygromyxa sp.]
MSRRQMTGEIEMQRNIMFTLGAMAAIGSLGVLWSCVDADEQVESDELQTRASVEPDFVAGNPSCEDLGYAQGLRIDPNSGTSDLPGGGTVTVTIDGLYFDWSSTVGIDAVIAKGGPNANVYVYDPPAESFGDTELHSPINPSTGMPFGLSHIDFCYDVNLMVTKTAETTFKRKRVWKWRIEKDVVGPMNLLLMMGQWISQKYQITLFPSLEKEQDSDWLVSGTITIKNPSTEDAAKIGEVVDHISDFGNVPVDCGVTFPYILPAGGTLNCTYSQMLPDGTNRVNTATAIVKADSKVDGGSGTAPINFGDPSETVDIDKCVRVFDDKADPQDRGKRCVDPNNPANLVEMYELMIHAPEQCGESEFVNTASFVTKDRMKDGSDSAKVIITVPCDKGCTLTQGYWKTHSQYGPAPYDDTWALVGEDIKCFPEIGLTNYEALTTPPGGNACRILLIQYVAAKLNIANGADSSAIESTYDAATQLLGSIGHIDNCPDNDKKKRAEIIKLAEQLAAWNEGDIGPGHCDE